MQKNKFLLLTNININVSILDLIPQQHNLQFDFLIHSVDKHDKHFADLRNIKLIHKRIDENSIVVFYLNGTLCLYVINELLKKNIIKNNTVVYTYSALLDFLSPQNPEFITHRTTVKLLESKLNKYILLPTFLLEEEYYQLLSRVNKKYFLEINNIRSLIISYKKLFQYLANNFSKWTNYPQKIYLINEDLKSFKELKNKIWSEHISALNFIENLPTAIKKHLSSFNRLEHSVAFKKMLDNYPWLIKGQSAKGGKINLIR